MDELDDELDDELVDELGGELDDDRPPICPACGVTMFIVDEGGAPHYACVECGFSDESGDSSLDM